MDDLPISQHLSNHSSKFPKIVHNFIMDMQQTAVHFDNLSETQESHEKIEEFHQIENPHRILDFIERQISKDPFCVICDFEIPNESVKNHFSEECHKNAFVIHGCESILQKENNYHCKICDLEIPTIERVYRHVKLVKHLSAANKKNGTVEKAKKSRKKKIINEELSPCIFIKKGGEKKYFCQICAEGGLFVWYKSLNFHISSKSHKEALANYACDNIISQGNKKYFCKCCNRKFHSMKLFYHIKSDEHLRNADRERNEMKIHNASLVTKKKISKKISNDEESQMNDSQILFCRYVSQQTAKNYSCRICSETKLRISRADVNNHIKGNRHRESLKKYGCDNIIFKENESYYCKICDCELDGRDMIYVHIKNEKHLNRVENCHFENREIEENLIIHDFSDSKENYKSYTRSREKKARLKSASVEKIDEKKIFDTVAQFQRYVFIATSDDKTFFCRICDDKSPIERKNIRNHSRGFEHKAALKKFGCENIVPIEENKFFCKCCNCDFVSKKKVCQHVKNEKHLGNAMKEKSDEDDRPKSSIEIEEDSRIKKTTKISEIFEISENPKSIIYLQNLSQNIFHCRICDGAESIVYRKRLNNHLTSRGHIDSLRKYACDSVVPKGNINYYCNRCDCEIEDIEEVCLHVRDEKHWISPRVPYRQNMISNFVLEENAEETEDNDLVIAENAVEESLEFGENFFNEQTDRDLSLHYISSDPEVLCKGKIPKFLKPFAVRIAKQRIDSPYCLICDYEISEYSAIDDHIMGKCHAKSVVSYGCDNIVRRDDDKFHCGSCNRGIDGIESVYRHIKTKGHLKRIRPEDFNDQYYKTATGRMSMAEGIKERLEVRQEAGDAEDGKPAEFNTIVSSLSADLSRMLASLKVNPTKKDKKDKKKAEKKTKPRRMRFKETSPDRKDGFSCAVCEITFPRKSDLHSHMTSHFSEEFLNTEKNVSDKFFDRDCKKKEGKSFTSSRAKFPKNFTDDFAADNFLDVAENLSDQDEISNEQIPYCSFR